MPDLLAHVFIAYSLCRVLSWRVPWLTTPYVTVGMVGAFIPDLVKIKLLLPSETMERVLGVPFDWGSLATGGGTLLSVCVGLALLASSERRRGGLVLGLGAGSHLLADSLLLTPTGRSVQLLWPLSQYRVPSPGLYLSTQSEPMLLAGGVAALVWVLDRCWFGGADPAGARDHP
ncbi:metal-dependent hydrolase [Haloplanus halobius]|uniref:metal-dependent hydrolase n=1 Tax=Haloplanus halobius TaxID=2934938 RepID=UPI00200D1EA9|nr:metal-dependent hydrolase [Haloplanus sp. XH21]